MRAEIKARYKLLRKKYLSARWKGNTELSEEHRREISLFLREYGRSQQKKPVGGKFAGRARIALKRRAADQVKELGRKIRVRGQAQLPRFLMATRYRRSPILERLLPDRQRLWKPPFKRLAKNRPEIVLNQFSFLDQPASTLQAFKDIGRTEGESVGALLHFDDPVCLDAAPYLVLAEIWPQMARIYQGGRMEVAVQKMIDAVELRKAMGMRLRDAEDRSDIWAFPLRRRRATGSSTDPERNLVPQTSEKVCDEFCDAFDEWTALAGPLGLSAFGRSYIQSIIGEMLNNAERHSDVEGQDGSWSVAAFMVRHRENGAVVHRVNLAFLSVGATIARSLETAADETRSDVATYVGAHRRSGLSAETLATVVALQDGVTRDASASAAGRGGVGFQDVMELLSALGATDDVNKAPRMTIVSGSSCVVIQAPYLQGAPRSEGGPRVIWFNPGNDPKVAPDERHVFDLQDTLAGTVVTMSFVVDGEYLKAAINADD